MDFSGLPQLLPLLLTILYVRVGGESNGLLAESVLGAPKLIVVEGEVDIVFTKDLAYIPQSSERLLKYAKAINKTDHLKLTLFSETALNTIMQNEVDKATRIQTKVKTFFSLLANKNKRTKRGIRLLSDLWHVISGAPGVEQAERWDKSLDMIRKGLKKQSELNSNNAQERILIHTVLDSHTETLKNLSLATTMMLKEAASGQNDLITTFNIISYMSALENWSDQLETVMFETEIAFVNGMSHHLSPYIANRTLLERKLQMIEAHEKMYKPLFGSTEAGKYYEHPLSKVSLTENAMHTVVTVPLVDFKQDVTIIPLTKDQKDQSKKDIYGFSYIAKSKGGNAYHFLIEQNELNNCLKVATKFVCKRRRAKIFRKGAIGDTVIYGSTNTVFLFKLSDQTEATLECPDQSGVTMMVGTSTAFVIPLNCSLTSVDFEIPRFSNQAQKVEDVRFTEISHPALALLDKRINTVKIEEFLNQTEYEANKKRLEMMSNLTSNYIVENNKLSETVSDLESILTTQTSAMASGFALTLLLTITLCAVMIICLCKYARTINSVANDLGPETKRISCCPC